MATYMYERKKGEWRGTKAKSKQGALKTFKKTDDKVRLNKIKLLRKPKGR